MGRALLSRRCGMSHARGQFERVAPVSFGCCCANHARVRPAEAAGGHAPASTRGSTRSAQPPRLRTRLSCRQYTIRATNATRSEIEPSGIKQPQALPSAYARPAGRGGPCQAAIPVNGCTRMGVQRLSSTAHAWYSAGVQGSACIVRVFNCSDTKRTRKRVWQTCLSEDARPSGSF